MPRLIAALDRASSEALDEGARAEPLRVFLQISLDGDADRGGVDVRRPDLVDDLCAAVDAAAGAGVRRADGDSAARLPTPTRRSRGSQAEHERVQQRYPQRLGLSAGMSGDLEAAVDTVRRVCVSVPRLWGNDR